MAFTAKLWKEQAQAQLKQAGTWLKRRTTQDSPYLVYGTLSGLSLWPLVQAAQAGELLPVVMALGSVAGGVGGNLLANQVQAWKDQADPVDETEVAQWVAEEIPNNPDLREALDAILEEMEAIAQAQAGLTTDDRQWFVQALRTELAVLGNQTRFEAQLIGDGQIVQGEGAIGTQFRKQGQAIIGSEVKGDVLGPKARKTVKGDKIKGDQVIVVKGDATFVTDAKAPVKMTAVARESALGCYLQHVISRNRYLQLQGIRSGGRLVHIELDRIYITLRTTQERLVAAEETWLETEVSLAPGEMGRRRDQVGPRTEVAEVSVNEALKRSTRLAVLGDPGSGKTTLLRYLALLYARDLAEGTASVLKELGLPESGRLPILLPLRKIGNFLRRQPDDSTEGHAALLAFLRESLANERIKVPDDFFDQALSTGQAVILLDGLDEVADPELRRRVSRLVEAFVRAYPTCRYAVTSRIVGYIGSARLGEDFTVTTVQDFTMADVEQFLINWHRLVAIGQMGTTQSAQVYAGQQTHQLLQAIQANDRIRELAINPLLLTVIAMVHRDRVKLPDRRTELYAEAVDILLGKWEEAKGGVDIRVLADKPFDTGDKRLILQNLALYMQEKEVKEIAVAELRQWLGQRFFEISNNLREVARIVDRFLLVIEERTGLLTARGEGVYAFSHLTFQEYLAALSVAGRDDYMDYTLRRVPDPWWREVILLAAGYLSTQSRERTSRLIRAIAELEEEPEPYHNLVLASECLRDVGNNRIESSLEHNIQQRLRTDIELDPQQEIKRRRPRSGWDGFWRRIRGQGVFSEKEIFREILERKGAITQALVRGGAGYWTLPYGEPEWIQIPAGKFWMGEDAEQVEVAAYAIARVPVTNAQYRLFVKDTDYQPPDHWKDDRPPRGKESHPVVNVSWYDAQAYCRWLSQVTGKEICLPTETEWEKAARGDQDNRIYPWGDKFDQTRCNTYELGLRDTTPVGVFQNGASPYGCLDMSGNVWEWCLGRYDEDKYSRVLRGGSWRYKIDDARSFIRLRSYPDSSASSFGFRVTGHLTT